MKVGIIKVRRGRRGASPSNVAFARNICELPPKFYLVRFVLRIWLQITSLFCWIRICPFVLSLSKDERVNPGAHRARPFMLRLCSARTVWREKLYREVILANPFSAYLCGSVAPTRVSRHSKHLGCLRKALVKLTGSIKRFIYGVRKYSLQSASKFLATTFSRRLNPQSTITITLGTPQWQP
jgi:hypothetical protein